VAFAMPPGAVQTEGGWKVTAEGGVVTVLP